MFWSLQWENLLLVNWVLQQNCKIKDLCKIFNKHVTLRLTIHINWLIMSLTGLDGRRWSKQTTFHVGGELSNGEWNCQVMFFSFTHHFVSHHEVGLIDCLLSSSFFVNYLHRLQFSLDHLYIEMFNYSLYSTWVFVEPWLPYWSSASVPKFHLYSSDHTLFHLAV